MKKLSLTSVNLSCSLLLCLFVLLHCKKQTKIEIKPFKNVLILGNSITKSSPDPAIGWYGDWGMAASAPEKDFVHILIDNFRKESPTVKVNYKNISDFEGGYWQYDLSKLDSLKNLNPDLIILRIGENVNSATFEDHQFKKHYTALINYMKTGNAAAQIVCVSNFWKNELIENVIKSCSMETNSKYVQLSQLELIANVAWDEYTNPGVRVHPSDKGMSAIADVIWTNITTLP
jgi:lysophospholipase L1-like esterase